ncbi:MAG: hypothetical protein ABSA17_01430 [Rhabdochlamydiaceae bacterium]|jgi:hypothetical protein
MHKVSSASVPNLWAYKTAGAIAGAAASRGAMHAFNIVPTSSSGLLLRAGFAFAGGWICSKLAHEVHSRALVDLQTKSHEVISGNLVKLTALTASTAGAALTGMSYEIALPVAIAGSIFSFFGSLVFFLAQKDVERDWLTGSVINAVPSLNNDQIRSMVKHAIKKDLWNIHSGVIDPKNWYCFYPNLQVRAPYNLEQIKSLQWIFLDTYISRDDVSPSEAIKEFKDRIEMIDTEHGKELSKTTIDKLLAGLQKEVDWKLLRVLLDMASFDAEKQKLILNEFPLGPGYVFSNDSRFWNKVTILHEDTIQALMANENASVWDVAFCGDTAKLGTFEMDQLLLLADVFPNLCNSETWKYSLLRRALESLPSHRVQPFLDKLYHKKSSWFFTALFHVLNNQTQARSFNFKPEWCRKILEQGEDKSSPYFERYVDQIWDAADTHLFTEQFFFDHFFAATPWNNYKKTLFWLERLINEETFPEAPAYVKEDVQKNPNAYGQILGLWKGAQKEADLLLTQRLAQSLDLGEATELFTNSFNCTLIDVYKEYIRHHSLEAPEIAKCLTIKEPLCGVVRVVNPGRFTAGEFSRFREVFKSHIMRRVTIKDLLALACSCRSLFHAVCVDEAERLWKPFGSLRAVHDMRKLYRLIPAGDNSDEANILREVIEQKLPELKEQPHA